MELLKTIKRHVPGRKMFVYVPILKRTEILHANGTKRVAETKKLFALKLNNKYKTSIFEDQNFAFYKQNSENGFKGKYLDEEITWKEHLTDNINTLEFSLIERTRRTNQLTRKQIFKINDKSSRKKFVRAVERNQVSKAVKMLNKGMDPNFVTETGNTPLGIACENKGTDDMILELIRNGASFHFRGKDGLTPLHRAAMCANYKAMLTLLRAGASPNYRDAKGLTPVYYSVATSDPFPCWVLLNCSPYHCDVDAAKSSAGETALLLAAQKGHLLQVKMLAEYGADVNAPIEKCKGLTLYHIAVLSGNTELAKILLENGTNIDCANIENVSRRYINSPFKLIFKIRKSDSKSNHQSHDHMTPLSPEQPPSVLDEAIKLSFSLSESESCDSFESCDTLEAEETEIPSVLGPSERDSTTHLHSIGIPQCNLPSSTTSNSPSSVHVSSDSDQRDCVTSHQFHDEGIASALASKESVSSSRINSWTIHHLKALLGQGSTSTKLFNLERSRSSPSFCSGYDEREHDAAEFVKFKANSKVFLQLQSQCKLFWNACSQFDSVLSSVACTMVY